MLQIESCFSFPPRAQTQPQSTGRKTNRNLLATPQFHFLDSLGWRATGFEIRQPHKAVVNFPSIGRPAEPNTLSGKLVDPRIKLPDLAVGCDTRVFGVARQSKNRDARQSR